MNIIREGRRRNGISLRSLNEFLGRKIQQLPEYHNPKAFCCCCFLVGWFWFFSFLFVIYIQATKMKSIFIHSRYCMTSVIIISVHHKSFYTCILNLEILMWLDELQKQSQGLTYFSGVLGWHFDLSCMSVLCECVLYTLIDVNKYNKLTSGLTSVPRLMLSGWKMIIWTATYKAKRVSQGSWGKPCYWDSLSQSQLPVGW